MLFFLLLPRFLCEKRSCDSFYSLFTFTYLNVAMTSFAHQREIKEHPTNFAFDKKIHLVVLSQVYT